MPFARNKFIFVCVGLATNFWSSLAPCHSAMVARSRHKNLCCLLVKFMHLFLANGIIPFIKNNVYVVNRALVKKNVPWYVAVNVSEDSPLSHRRVMEFSFKKGKRAAALFFQIFADLRPCGSGFFPGPMHAARLFFDLLYDHGDCPDSRDVVCHCARIWIP